MKHEENLLSDKLSYRFCAFDLNVDKVGCCIMDYKPRCKNKFKIVRVCEWNIKPYNVKPPKDATIKQRKKINNRRKNAIYKMWSDISKVLKLYKVGYVITEDLDIKPSESNCTETNRKIFNCWNRVQHEECIGKYCSKLGFIWKQVNCAYSTFIGNMTFDYIDSINAAAELCRRGIYTVYNNKNIINRDNTFLWYSKGELGTIDHAISRLELINKGKTIDVVFFKDGSFDWIKFYGEVTKSGLGYRVSESNYSKMCGERTKIVRSPIFRHDQLCKLLFEV